MCPVVRPWRKGDSDRSPLLCRFLERKYEYSNGLGMPVSDERYTSTFLFRLFANPAYASSIGNKTWTVSPLQPAIFPATYRSTTNTFSTGAVLPVNESGVYSPSVFSSTLVNYTFISLTAEIFQNFAFNLFCGVGRWLWSQYPCASAVCIKLHIFAFICTDDSRDSWIRGLSLHFSTFHPSSLFWQTSSIRLLYSLNATPPASCIRTVTGSVTYETTGWFVKRSNIGFLIPYTLINFIALFALVQTVTFAKQNGYPDPFQPRDVQYDPIFSGEIPPQWKDEVYAVRLFTDYSSSLTNWVGLGLEGLSRVQTQGKVILDDNDPNLLSSDATGPYHFLQTHSYNIP